MKARWFLIGLALAGFGMVGCATDVGTIDRTQHDKLLKKQFGGVWFMNQTVIDIPQSAAFSFVGETNFGGTGKVIFDIKEKHLVVYPVVEYVEDSEKEWQTEDVFRYWDDACTSLESESYQCVDGVDNLNDPSRTCCFVRLYVGQPMAMFEIASHFDVMRQYNAQTGEQTNVLVENTTDRKWWQRSHIRVNWARNLVNDFAFMARIASQTGIDYYVQSFDETNPDAPTFTPDYMDIVTKIYGNPESTGACYIYGVSTGDCAAAVVKFRTAFRKVDTEQNYEPLRFHNEDYQPLFGYFLTERNTLDEDWGLTETGRVSFINRWNLWDNSFDESELVGIDGNPKVCFKDLKDTGCDTRNIEGSREFCKADDWFTRGTCVLRTPRPYTQRGLRPVVYAVSPDLPEFLWPATVRSANQWSAAFKDTVAWLYLYEEMGLIEGQNQVRDCQTNADCSTHAIVDRTFELDDVDGDSLPKNPSGRVIWTNLAKTVVVGNGRSVAMPDWGYPDGLTTQCAIRFVNASGSNYPTLLVNGSVLRDDQNVALFQVVEPMTQDSLDPSRPAHVRLAPSDSIHLAVTENDVEIDALSTPCPRNSIVTIVFDGTSLFAATALRTSVAGLRVVNATDKSLDISVNGGLRFGSLLPQDNTGYLGIAGGANGVNLPADFVPQRLVATLEGSRGDLTCYRSQQISKCVGYGAAMTQDDWARFTEIRAKLPELFVQCRNQYTPADPDGGALNDDMWKSPLYAPWNQISSATAEDIEKLPVLNPCVDFLFKADRMDEDQKLAQAAAMKKIGDSRYSSVNWISESQFASPLGYGPSAADPDTGEIFWGTANIYGAYMYYYGAMYRDIFDLISGKLDTQDYVTGQMVRDWLAGNGTDSRAAALTSEPVESLISAHHGHDHAHHHHIDPASINIPPEALQDQFGKPITHMQIHNILKDKELGQRLTSGLPVMNPARGKARLNAIKGSAYEHLLVNEEVRYATRDGQDRQASPLEWANLQEIMKKEQDRLRFLSDRNYCYAEFNDEGMLGIVRSWACIGNDPRPRCDVKTFNALDTSLDQDNPCCIDDGEALAEFILIRFYAAVVEHEVGHTVGLRHNFAASSDVFNFFDKYYDIREKEPIPCVIDSECDQILGMFCQDGYCHRNVQTDCSAATDCGFLDGNGRVTYYDHFDCVSSKCVEIVRCGVQGQCPEGHFCDGESRACFRLEGGELVRAQKEVQGGTEVVRQMIPRGPLTPAEAASNRTMFQYSSIMDYGQRWNSDLLGLGKYDNAAIRFGYGLLVDTYQDLTNMHKSIHQYAQGYGQPDTDTSDTYDTSYWNWGVYFSQFYFLNNYITADANRTDGDRYQNRAAVPYEQLRMEQSMVQNYYRQYLDFSRVMVPYKFSGDEYRGNVGVYTWDTGMDALEIVHNMSIQLKEYYLMDAFKRDRYGFGLRGDPIGYMTRVQTRFMEPMRGTAMYYALFGHILKNYGWRAIWANARMMGYGLRRASETGFEILANSLASPAPGSYQLVPGQDMYRNISYDMGVSGSEMDVPLGTGKYPYTSFWDGAGYFYWNHALYIGSFWEKMAAIMTLTDSTVYFTTNYVGEQLNIGVGTSIGFNTMYPRQLTEVFGGMIAGDTNHFAWPANGGKAAPKKYFEEFNPDAYVIQPSPYLTPSKEVITARIEPSIENQTLKMYLMLFGMAYLPASFDPSFLDSFSICLKGNGNCHDLSEKADLETREFTDPFGGKTYLVWAPKYTLDWYAPNLSLLDRAQRETDVWNAAEGEAKTRAEMQLRETVDTLDMLRSVYEIYNSMRI